MSVADETQWREITAGWSSTQTPSAIDCAFAGDAALDIAMLHHLLGQPDPDIRLWLSRAATAFALLFEAPTPDAMPVRYVNTDGPTEEKPPCQDKSLTNATRALLVLHLMAVVGEDSALERIASRIEEVFPPGTSDPESALALAFAALSRGKDAVAIFHAAGVQDDDVLQLQADAVRALVERDPAMISKAISLIRDAHSREVATDPNLDREPRKAMSLPALACESLARRRAAA